MTFQPGQSGNPAGRPKGSRTRAPLKDALNKYLNEKDKDGNLRLDVLAGKLYGMAIGGDVQAMKLIYERMEGKPKQAIEVSTDTPARLEVILTNGKDTEGKADDAEGTD